jgi:hypothetical protein
MIDRMDVLESSLRALLQEARNDTTANAKELGIVTALVKNACRPGARESSQLNDGSSAPEISSSVPPSNAAQQDQTVRVGSNVLLRRLKRGCLLQYEQYDDDDEEREKHRAETSENFFIRFKRHVGCPKIFALF